MTQLDNSPQVFRDTSAVTRDETTRKPQIWKIQSVKTIILCLTELLVNRDTFLIYDAFTFMCLIFYKGFDHVARGLYTIKFFQKDPVAVYMH